MKSDFIWFDGKLVPWGEAQVHVMTHTLHYGVGVFEGIRAYKCEDGSSAVFRLAEHVDRLFDSAKIFEIVIPFSREEIIAAIIATLQANKMAEGYIRPIVFIGTGLAMGVHPGKNPIQVAIATWPWGAYLGADALEKGIKIKTSSFARHHVNVMMTKSKTCGNYVNSVLAKQDAVADGCDEAMMLDPDGFVAEGTGENIFIVRKGRVKTPPLTSILPGITRDCIMEMVKSYGYELVEQRFTRDEVYISDEAFFTGTAAEITPIREVDRRIIGPGHAGELTKRLQADFFKIVEGKDKKHLDWLYKYSL